MPRPISRDELERAIAGRTVLIVEALSADYFADGHLPGAINVPLSTPDLPAAITAATPGSQIVVYGSRSGGEADELALRIESATTADVRIYAAGKEDWVEADLPIER